MAIDLSFLTAMQRKAVMEEGSNVLVSAGAGSGKTRVLALRVMRKLDDGVSLDNLVILTFTRLAAEEMRNRIRTYLEKEPNLISELDKIDSASISTFDAFALALIRKYHYLIGLNPNIGIADDAILAKLKDKCLQDTIDGFYESGDREFLEVADLLFDRNDDRLSQAVLKAAGGLENLPDRKEYLRAYPTEHLSEAAIDGYFDDFGNYLEESFGLLKPDTDFEHMHDALPKVEAYYAEMRAFYKELEGLATTEERIKFLCDRKFPQSLRKSKDLDEDWLKETKEIHDSLKNKFDSLAKDIASLQAETAEELKRDIRKTGPVNLEILRIADAYLDSLDEAMKAGDIYHFNDIMHMAIGLLRDNPEVLREVKEGINEIMVDEYQDTNDVQEYLLDLIGNGNIFMVGDVKQSIYGFRNANPGIFREKYHRYAKNRGGVLIDLRENFRSREEVLQAINDIFTPLMDETIGGIDFHDNQSMKYALKAYDKFKAKSAGIKVLAYDKEKRPAEEDTAETEARAIGSDILKRIKGKETVMDKHTQESRLLKWGDIAIIADRKTSFSVIGETLVAMHIPVRIHDEEPFLMTEEIMFIWQFMKASECIGKKNYSGHVLARALMSMARSFVYRIPDEVIVGAFLDNRIESEDDLEKLSHVDGFQRIIGDIMEIVPDIDTMPLCEILPEIADKTEIYAHIATLYDPLSCQNRLDYLFGKALDFQALGFSGFLEYMDSVNDLNDVDIGYQQPLEEVADSVTVLTMHKSKGLEFPVCYYASLDKKFNFTDNVSLFVFDKTYGLVTKTWDDGFKPNIMKFLLSRKNRREYVSERIRLLYVALTRAREEMVLVLPEEKTVPHWTAHDSSGVISVHVRQSLGKYSDVFPLVGLDDRNVSQGVFPTDEELKQTQVVPSHAPGSIIHMQPGWKKEEMTRESYSKSGMDIVTKSQKEAMAYGTKIHETMEFVDFGDLAGSLAHLELPLREKIGRIVRMEPFVYFKDMEIHQEYPFYTDTGNTMKSGVIDLLAISRDKAFIVDYKLKSTDDDAYVRQLHGYRDYIEEKTGIKARIFLCSLTDERTEEVY